MTKSKESRDKLVRELSELLDETGLTEIEIEDEGIRVRVARSGSLPADAPPPTAAQQATPPGAVAAAGEPPGIEPGTVVSPMVGTVYMAPEPGADPFIKTGAKIEEGQTLMIIEAMKVMNPLLAPHGGTVKEILVSDSQPVEYDEPLLIIV